MRLPLLIPTFPWLGSTGKAQEALQQLHKGLQRWPTNGYLALLAANLEAKQGHTDNARKMYAVAAAHARSTIAAQVFRPQLLQTHGICCIAS